MRGWMKRNVHRFVDALTGEVNCTALVEAWDAECSTGAATLDPDHEAWDAAVDVAERFEKLQALARERGIPRGAR